MATLTMSGSLHSKVIAPMRELIAYEALWDNKNASVKKISELFASSRNLLPSDLVSKEAFDEMAPKIQQIIHDSNLEYDTNFLVNGSYDYPKGLSSAKHKVEALYYSGNLNLLNTNCIAIVGTRRPSDDGIKRATKMATLLVENGFTIVSGLAEGIDTSAHKAAIAANGNTIAVIGTPLHNFYPKSNSELQKYIALNHLLLSQVPFYHYKQISIFGQRSFFPERNKTMSALTQATIIIEAGETSGTLIQAKAALEQGRKLFILESCFHNKNISWPEKFLNQGAIRVKAFSDIANNLG